MIAVIDYGRGNLGSVEKAFGRLGMRAVVTEDPRVVEDAEAVVLPGDGAFHDAMTLGRGDPDPPCAPPVTTCVERPVTKARPGDITSSPAPPMPDGC